MLRKIISIMLALLMAGSAVPAFAEAPQGREAEALSLVSDVMGGEIDALWARLDASVKEQITEGMLSMLGSQLEQAYGAFQGFGGTQAIGQSINVLIHMAGGDLIAQVVYNDDEQIVGFGFTPSTQQAADTSLAEGEEEVAVGPKKLAGVLTMPQNAEGKVPAVVLVQGSGSSDRNEAVGALKPFKDLAEGLSAQGIAVLRYDKRTYAWQTGAVSYTPEELANLTVFEETIEDAIAGVQLLKADDRIDADRVFVLGHSQGGMLANRIQLEGADAAGLIIMAGTLRNLATLVVDQLQALAGQGTPGLAGEIETAKALPGMAEAEARGKTLLGSNAYPIWEEAQHDLTAVAEQTDAPMLILQGEDDVQVYAAVDYVLWEEFAQAHPERDIELNLYKGLGHMMDVDGKVSTQVIDDIANWIMAR